MTESVFFDLDGTLLDTLPDIHTVLNDTCARFGYPALTEEQTKAYVGEGARRLIERALPENAPNVDECFEWFKKRYAESDNALTKPYDGIPALLETLKRRGVKLAVVTNKPQGATENAIGSFFPGVFDFVGGDSGMFSCKPDPSLARYAALTMRVALRNSVFVGDGEPDVLTAKNAGMRGISVLWGYRSREQLEKVGAREFVSSAEELLGKLL